MWMTLGRVAKHAEAQLFHVIEWLEEGVVLFDAQHGMPGYEQPFRADRGLAPEETGRVTTLNRLITRLADHAAEPEKFATRWRETGVRLGHRRRAKRFSCCGRPALAGASDKTPPRQFRHRVANFSRLRRMIGQDA